MFLRWFSPWMAMGLALGCSSAATPAADASAGDVVVVDTTAPTDAAITDALAADASVTRDAPTVDVGAPAVDVGAPDAAAPSDGNAPTLCEAFCDRGLSECRTGSRNECLGSCRGALDSPCGARVRAAFQCAAARTGWSCGGPNPFAAACAEAVAAVTACMSSPPDASLPAPDV